MTNFALYHGNFTLKKHWPRQQLYISAAAIPTSCEENPCGSGSCETLSYYPFYQCDCEGYKGPSCPGKLHNMHLNHVSTINNYKEWECFFLVLFQDPSDILHTNMFVHWDNKPSNVIYTNVLDLMLT